uniref:Protein kinase domain-containing protein n=1 Tax=Syphacia muris TaxID=451379 RepID=A0A0N5B013_9BILA
MDGDIGGALEAACIDVCMDSRIIFQMKILKLLELCLAAIKYSYGNSVWVKRFICPAMSVHTSQTYLSAAATATAAAAAAAAANAIALLA